MGRTNLEFIVIYEEAPRAKEDSYDRPPRVIHILEDSTHTAPIYCKTRLDPMLQ
jgi:hypothetical protein